MITFFQISPQILEVAWPKIINQDTLREKIHFQEAVLQEFGPSIHSHTAGYHTLDFCFHAPIDAADTIAQMEDLYRPVQELPLQQNIFWKVPVWYNGRDLEAFATAKGLSTKEVIELHTAQVYTIHFYGFLPGFLYLGGLDERLTMPRKDTPDRTVPKGSVAIGGSQTGIYPLESPGGWHLLGTTPVELFNPNAPAPVWASVGDSLRFYPVDENEYRDCLLQEKKGLICEEHER